MAPRSWSSDSLTEFSANSRHERRNHVRRVRTKFYVLAILFLYYAKCGRILFSLSVPLINNFSRDFKYRDHNCETPTIKLVYSTRGTKKTVEIPKKITSQNQILEYPIRFRHDPSDTDAVPKHHGYSVDGHPCLYGLVPDAID
jgi:hypothetical protein